MARITPISIPSGVTITISGQDVNVKGSKGNLDQTLHASVEVAQNDGQLTFTPRKDAPNGVAHSGTARALLNNMITGVSEGFEKKLELVGVGYRA